jgi:hypothetical protein
MKQHPLANADDFAITGMQVDEERFDIHTVIDRRDKIVYNFTDSFVDGRVPGFENVRLHYNVAMYSNVFMSVRGRPGGPPVPDMLRIRLPIFDGDNFTVRNAMRLLATSAID